MRGASKVVIAILGGAIVVVLAVIAFVFLMQNNTVKTEWGKVYYEKLQQVANEKHGAELGLKEGGTYNLSFIEAREVAQPVMALSNDEALNLLYFDGEELKAKALGSVKLEYLYDMAAKTYDYYVVTEVENVATYTTVTKILTADGTADYTIDTTKQYSAKDKDTGETIGLTIFDKTFVRPLINTDKIEFVYSEEAGMIEAMQGQLAKAEGKYKTQEQIASEMQEAVDKAVAERAEIIAKVDEIRSKQVINKDNFHEMADETLKYFMAAYLGPANGWELVYKYRHHASADCEKYQKLQVESKFNTCVEVVGVSSKAEMQAQLEKYVSESARKEIDKHFTRGILGDFSEYDGKVWWIEEGSKNGLRYNTLAPSNAKFVSTDAKGVTTVTWALYQYEAPAYNFTLKLAYMDGAYQVLSFTLS